MIGEYELNKVMCLDSYKAIKSIPDKSVSLIVTDPPYEIETEGGENIYKSNALLMQELKDSDICKGINIDILDEFMRIMKKPNIYIWCNKKQIPEYLDYFVTKHNCSFEILVWIKTNPTPLCGGNYLIDKEFCLYFRKGVLLNTTFDTAKTWFMSSKNKSDKDIFYHPTIKPLEFIKTLIKNSSNEDEVVFDAFTGSGTTAVACQETGRNFIGSEISEKWCKIANDRLNKIDANGQSCMFLR